jgi:hypothetical protein
MEKVMLKQFLPSEIYAEAVAAAAAAANAENAKLPPEQMRGLDCGFAWVVVKPARGPFVSWCKKNGCGRSHHAGGWCFWSPGKANTQSMSVHQAGAEAFAEVLKAHGINADADYRYD